MASSEHVDSQGSSVHVGDEVERGLGLGSMVWGFGVARDSIVPGRGFEPVAFVSSMHDGWYEAWALGLVRFVGHGCGGPTDEEEADDGDRG